MTIPDIWTLIFSLIGLLFCITGTIGLLRFPDVFCRLHALTKADNLGLGFIVVAFIPQVQSPGVAFHLLLIWALVLLSSAAGCYLIARHALSELATQKSLRGKIS